MLFRLFFWLIIGLFVFQPFALGEKKGLPPDLEAAIATLQFSNDSDALAKSAIYVCAFPWPFTSGKRTLMELLKKKEFLDRLDQDTKPWEKIRLSLVLPALIKELESSTEGADIFLLSLEQNENYSKNAKRLGVIFYAFQYIKSPNQEAIKLLEKYASSWDFHNLAILSLIRISTPKTLAIVEERMLSPNYTDAEKREWCLNGLAQLRNDPNIVRLYRRLTSSKIMENKFVRNTIAQTLFSSPKHWSSLEKCVDIQPPPARKNASTQVLLELEKIADIVLQFDLYPETKKDIESAQKEIREILNDRGTKESPTKDREQPMAKFGQFFLTSLLSLVGGLGLGIWWSSRKKK